MTNEHPKRKSTRLPTRKKDLPATVGLVWEVRDELKSEIRSLEHRMDARFKHVDARFDKIDARFNEVDARFSKIDARFNEVDARFNEVDARFSQLDSKIDQVLVVVHGMQAMMEQQYGENRIMLEKLSLINDRQDRLEKRQDENDVFIRQLARRNGQ